MKKHFVWQYRDVVFLLPVTVMAETSTPPRIPSPCPGLADATISSAENGAGSQGVYFSKD